MWCGSGSCARPRRAGRADKGKDLYSCPSLYGRLDHSHSLTPQAAGGEAADDRRPRGGVSTRRPPVDCSNTLLHEAGRWHVSGRPGQLFGKTGSTRLRVEGSSEIHVRELKNPAVTAEDFGGLRDRGSARIGGRQGSLQTRPRPQGAHRAARHSGLTTGLPTGSAGCYAASTARPAPYCCSDG
jgi:hypothetical protein